MTPLRLVAAAAALIASVAVEVRPVSEGRIGGAYEASLTRFGDGFAAAWYDTRDGVPSIYVRRLTATGAPAGPELRLTRERTAYEPDIVALGSRLIVAWYEYDEQDGFRAMAGSFSGDGRQQWVRRLSSPGYLGRNAIVRTDGKRIAVSWIQERRGSRFVAVQWFDARGKTAWTPSFFSDVSETTWNVNGAVNPVREENATDRSVWLTWDAPMRNSAAHEIVLARVAGAVLSGDVTFLTKDDGVPSKYPDLAFADNGTMALAWFDERDGNEEIYLAVGPQSRLRSGVEDVARRVTRTRGASIGAYLAWNGDRLGLAWCDNTVGQHEIYFQSFDKTGVALDDPRQITDSPADSLIPSIRPFGDGFALLWNEFIAGPGGGHDPRSRSTVTFARVSVNH